MKHDNKTLMELEHVYLIFVLLFSIEAPKYALIDDLQDFQ